MIFQRGRTRRDQRNSRNRAHGSGVAVINPEGNGHQPQWRGVAGMEMRNGHSRTRSMFLDFSFVGGGFDSMFERFGQYLKFVFWYLHRSAQGVKKLFSIRKR